MFHPYSFYLQKHKNAKIKRESALPFSASPYYFTSLFIPPMSQTAFYYVPFHHLGYPILPFGVSHFTIWDVPFDHLGYPILPFGVSHFAIWDVPFCHLGCPILPFGVSHFTFWDVPFYHLGYPISPFGVSHLPIWGIPFHHLGCPILPFGISHFAIWGIFSAHLRTMYSPIFGLSSSFFAAKDCMFLSFRFIMFFMIHLAG